MTVTFFDIDETLFSTCAKILVRNSNTGKIKRKLNNREFNTYKLKNGEVFDFVEFSDTNIFIKTSSPITKVIEILKESYNNGEEVYLLTARPDFDNKQAFIDFLNSHGINAGHKNDGKIHVIRAGNIKGSDSATKKKNIIKQILKTKKYSSAKMYEDSMENLEAFKSLSKDFNIIFKCYSIFEENIIDLNLV
jgi:hypothetical protein